jgi:predicted GNAT family N-acyltransferase
MARYKETPISKKDLYELYSDRKGVATRYETTIYEPVDDRDSDIYIIAQEGDRLDLLANQFYDNYELWWFIGRVNNISTMNIPAGTSLRIPVTIEQARGG